MLDTLRLPGPLLVIITCSWLGGILLASTLAAPLFIYLLASCISLLLLLAFWSHLQTRLLLLLTLCFFLGASRYTQNTPTNDPLNVSHWLGSVEIQGTVSDEPISQGRSRLLHVTVSQIKRSGSPLWHEAHGQVAIQVLGLSIEDPYSANYGDTIDALGKLQPPTPHSSSAIAASMPFPKLGVLQTTNTPLSNLFHLRVVLANAIEHSLPQPEAALLVALLLSLHTPSLKPLRTAFNVTGTAHLIAPSGFKVTLLAGFIFSLLSRLLPIPRSSGLPAERRGGWRAYTTTLMVILSILLYTLLSGAGPAAIRAGIMGSLLVIAPRIGRTYNIYTALSFTALLMSLADPLLLWDAGFQLSFSGTLGIVVLTPHFQNLLRSLHLARIPFGETLLEICAVTLAAQTATLPFFATNFQQISFVAPLANLLTVPLLGIFILLGLFLCILYLLAPPISWIAAWLVHPLLWYTNQAVLFCAHLPGAYLTIDHLDTALGFAYYLLLLLSLYFLHRKQTLSTQSLSPVSHQKLSPQILHRAQLCVALLILLTTGICILTAPLTSHLTLTFLSVGPTGKPPEGEAVLLQTSDGKTMLIDGGIDPTSLSQTLDQRLPSWQRSLDVVLLTTPLSDHLNGLLTLPDRYSINTVVDAGVLHPNTTYALWRRTINENNIHYLPVQQGMQFSLGKEAIIQILWPTSTLHKGTNELRDNSLVLRIITPFMRVLLLGSSAESRYALQSLLTSVDDNSIQADAVQVEGEESTRFAPLLQPLLAKTHASLLIETPAAGSSRKGLNQLPVAYPPSSPSLLLPGSQILLTRELGSLELSGNSDGISFSQI